MIKKISPQKGAQELFLRSNADILIYGGARGGGKSFALLLEVLRYINNPKFNAVIFRRTYPQINAEGGLWDKSCELFPLVNATANKSSVKWTFPSGATCSFRHLKDEQDKLNWQGSEICYLGFDELTHFTLSMFNFMMSCNRSTCGVKPFIRGTCNPDPNSWVKKLIKPYLTGDGYANPRLTGTIKNLIIDGNDFKFIDNNCGDEDFENPLSFSFINADIYDNPILLERDPKYLQMLKTLPLIERERFLGKKGYGGNWNIKAEAGTIFKREWFTITNSSQNLINGIRFWDFGATTLKNIRTGDFTVGLLLFYNSSEDNYLIKDIIRIKLPPAHTNKLLLETAYKDGQNIMIRWQQEPGASGVRDSLNIQNILKGFNAKGIIDNRDKVSRALPLSYLVEQGKFNLQLGEWNNDFLSEAEGFPDISKHDDQVDALSGAFNEICRPKFRESNFKY